MNLTWAFSQVTRFLGGKLIVTAKGKGIGLLEVNTLLFLFVDLLGSLRFSWTRTTTSTGFPP